jgi:hypothetical protein
MSKVSMEVTIDAAAALWLAKRGSENPSETILRLSKYTTAVKPVARDVTSAVNMLERGKSRFEVLGQRVSAKSAQESFLAMITLLAEIEPKFMHELSARSKSRIRNHFSLEADDVYPGRRDLKRHVVSLPNGWHVGTNISNQEKRKFLMIGCDILGLEFGKDVIFEP